MKTNTTEQRILIILLISLLFLLLGWVAPAMFATHAPDAHFFESHSFEAEDTTTANESHELYWDRTIHEQRTGTILIELTMVSSNGERIDFQTYQQDAIYQEGRQATVMEQELPEDVSPGVYEYEMVVQMQLADGRVTRTFFVTSDEFTIESA